ncbi:MULTISPECIES: SPOR domain-containing protein [unclassified Desulfurobacterium]|uniref:SPOR domain-containing protein n=1 Tax=Desulfurobacterium sp. TC5-1 TaxID=1158318 RepID=UPI0003B6B9CC|nr:SPOR domain-containing protein [Desulfurobacterium sp. TC5-1]
MKKIFKIFLIATLSLIFFVSFLNDVYAKETPVYTIQLVNTKDKREAEIVFKKIEKLEYSRIDKVKTRYKVRVGFFKTKQEARNYLKKHPEIKKISPTAYITLNYYDPERTIEKGFFPPEKKREQPNINKPEISNKKQQYNQRSSVSREGNSVKVKKELKPTKSVRKEIINSSMFKKYLLYVVMAVSGISAAAVAVMLLRKYNVEETLCCIGDKFQNVYVNALKCIPLKTSKKILEYHYRKIGDFRSLILMKLQDQDFNFILRETPRYLLKHPDDILVWKIYIEVLSQLGIFSEAATACEKLAEILRKNARPEAAENYLKKAEEFRKKTSKLLENAG